MSSTQTEHEGRTGAEIADAERVGGTGLDSNVAGALSYLLGFVTGIVFYVLEPEDEFVRFHAAQSIVTFGAIFLASFVVGTVLSLLTGLFVTGVGLSFVAAILGVVFGLVWLVFGLGTLALWLFLMLRAYQGETVRVPVAANLADRLV